MAISIAWGTRIISIPQGDLTLVSGSIYSLDVDVFRLALKSLEDDEEGMPYPRTHNHNTEVTIAGVTFARTVEIINDYTVTFEDGQYTVLLAGANNNLFDVAGGILNQNQVQIVPSNSAGLIVKTVTSGSGLDNDQNAVINQILELSEAGLTKGEFLALK